jgi:uncharacterized membrane protein
MPAGSAESRIDGCRRRFVVAAAAVLERRYVMNVAGRHFSWLSVGVCCLMVVAAVLALGFGFGVAPWAILVGAFCVLMMGSMLWMMGTHGMHRSERHSRAWAPEERRLVDKEERPVEILDRRFAEGAITPEDYQARRAILVNGNAKPNGAQKDEQLTVPQGGARRQ